MSKSQEFAGKVYDKLASLLDDMTSLTVATYTINEAGQSVLRANTKIELDGDTTNQIPINSEGKLDEELLKQHQRTLDQARAERKSLVDALLTLVKGQQEIEKAEAE